MDEIVTPIKINIPTDTSIGICFQNKLQLAVDGIFGQNPHDLVCKSRSNRLDCRWRRVPRDRFKYVSSIARQIDSIEGASKNLDFSDNSPPAAAYPQLEVISSWHPDGYLYWQLTAGAIDTWLNYLPDRLDSLWSFSAPVKVSQISPSGVLYARHRCRGLLNIARCEGIEIHRSRAEIYLDRPVYLPDRSLIFTLNAELDLIATYIDFIDTLAGANRQKSIDRATIDLALSWLEFHRHCRIIGIDRPLAIARAALTQQIWYALDRSLADYWGIVAPME
jgi:hypothetical protein